MARPSVKLDLVQRLREGRTDGTALRWQVTDIHREAASEIESLRARLAEVEGERDRAEAQVVSAWNAFGPPGCSDTLLAETAAEVYDQFLPAAGDIADQIKCIEQQLSNAESRACSSEDTVRVLREARTQALEWAVGVCDHAIQHYKGPVAHKIRREIAVEVSRARSIKERRDG